MNLRNSSLLAISVLLFLTISAAVVKAQETNDYTIDNYELTIQSFAGRSDAAVTMDITYLINSGRKSTGFKYIGPYAAQQLSGADDTGNPMRTWVSQERETKLNWSFASTGPGRKRIIISFTIPGFISDGPRDGNTLVADWAGVFKVRVRRAAYRFIFPDDIERTIATNMTIDSNVVDRGKRRIEAIQQPLSKTLFKVDFSPRIAKGAPPALAATNRTGGSSGGDSGWIIAVVFGVIMVIVGAISTVFRRARRLSGGGGTWWSGSSSCAGASSSSCGSSSCGSSCGGGGGCGGGCGG